MSVLENITVHKNECRKLISHEIGRINHIRDQLSNKENKELYDEFQALLHNLGNLQQRIRSL